MAVLKFRALAKDIRSKLWVGWVCRRFLPYCLSSILYRSFPQIRTLPKLRSQPDLRHEMKRKALGLHWKPVIMMLKDEVASTRCVANQNYEGVCVWWSTIILLHSHFIQEPFQHYQWIFVGPGNFICEHGRRDCWRRFRYQMPKLCWLMTETGAISVWHNWYLSIHSFKFLPIVFASLPHWSKKSEITFMDSKWQVRLVNVNPISLVLGVVFLLPKNKWARYCYASLCGSLSQCLQSLLTLEELSIIDQLEWGQITLVLYSLDPARIIRCCCGRSAVVINATPAKENPKFLMGHPK